MDIFYAVNAKIPNDKAHGIQIIKTCEALALAGNNVSLIVAGHSRIDTDPFEFYGVRRNFNIVRLPVINFPFLGSVIQFILRSGSYYACLYPFLLLHLVRNFFRRKKSVIYVRGEAILALAPVFFAANLVWESHTLRGHKELYKAIIPLLTGMVVITDKYLEDLIATGRITRSKLVCARDAVDITEFDISISKDDARQKLDLPKEKTIVLYTGQLAEHKGIDALLKSKQYLSANFLILIAGGTSADIATYSSKYPGEGIQFLGTIHHGQIPLYLKAADVLVLPDSAKSEYGRLHTSPMKMFEYMASKRPIVASDVSSLREVLNEKNAIMFVPDDGEDLAAQIQKVADDSAFGERIAHAAYETVQEFSWTKRAVIIDTFLNSIV